MKPYVCILLLAIFSFSLSLNILHAQDTSQPCGTSEEQRLIEQLNLARAAANTAPMAQSSILCEVTRGHLNDLISRPPDSILSNELASSGTGYEVWLAENGYQAYEAGYRAKMFVWTAYDTPLDAVPNTFSGFVTYMVAAPAGSALKQMIDASGYREIGVSYRAVQQFDGRIRYYYVIIFGSQPNVFPALVVNPIDLKPMQEAFLQDVGVLVRNETFFPDGEPRGTTVGRINHFLISENESDLAYPCPIPGAILENGWQSYPTGAAPIIPFRLSGKAGMIIIYIKVCDTAQREKFTQAQVVYQGGFNPPLATATPLPTSTPDLKATAQYLYNQTSTALALVALSATPTPTVDINGTIAAELLAIEQANTAIALSYTPTSTSTPTLTPTIAPSNTPDPSGGDSPEATFTPTFTNTPTNTPVVPTPTPTPTTPSPLPPVDNGQIPPLTLYWNPNFLVISNTSANAVSLNTLERIDILNQNGAGVRGTLWRERYPEMSELRVGRCLVAYNAADSQPTIAMISLLAGNCRTDDAVTVWAGISSGDMVWALAGGENFSIYYDGSAVQTCDYRQQTSCVLASGGIVTPTSMPVTLTPGEVGEMTAIWTTEIFVLKNTSGRVVNLSQVYFANVSAQFTWAEWIASNVLANIQPETCLAVYSGDTMPTTPDNQPCPRGVGLSMSIGTERRVWNRMPFDVIVNGSVVATCHQGTSCRFNVPVSR